MDFNKSVFIMARCCNTVQNYLRPQESGGVNWHHVLILLFLILFAPSDVGWRPYPTMWGHCPGMYGAHYEHDTLISHQFQYRTSDYSYVDVLWTGTLGHMPRHLSRTSLYNNKHTTDLTLVLIMILDMTWHDSTNMTWLNNTNFQQL